MSVSKRRYSAYCSSKAIQTQQRLLMETTYDMEWNIGSPTPASTDFQFVVPISGYASFGEVVKMIINVGSVIPFRHNE